MNRTFRFSAIALLLLIAPLLPAAAADPAPSTGPFSVAGSDSQRLPIASGSRRA